MGSEGFAGRGFPGDRESSSFQPHSLQSLDSPERTWRRLELEPLGALGLSGYNSLIC